MQLVWERRKRRNGHTFRGEFRYEYLSAFGPPVAPLSAPLLRTPSLPHPHPTRTVRLITVPYPPIVPRVPPLNVFFFPSSYQSLQELTAKDEVKRRLRMVLVADRCGLSPGTMTEMKSEIVDAIRKYVDIKGDEEIEVNVSMDPEVGTVYSVNIPVKRVKAVVKQKSQSSSSKQVFLCFPCDNNKIFCVSNLMLCVC